MKRNFAKHPPYVALAGLSVRFLAQSAARAGLSAVALDVFGDRDTRRLSALWFDIGGAGVSVDRARLMDALSGAARLPGMIGVIAAGGLEAMTGAWHEAERTHGGVALPKLIGNDAEALAAVRNPRRFFTLLDTLGVGHPPVCFDLPAGESLDGWLSKHADGCGGAHVEPARAGPLPPGRYYQRRAAGRPMSALFLAARGESRVIGFAEQFTLGAAPCPYLHTGAAGPVDLTPPVTAQLHDAIAKIVAKTGLTGLNSMDFLLDGATVRVLEINARPSSTMSLYEAAWPERWPRGLLACHLDACLHGRLPPAGAPPAAPARIAAQRVVFATHALTVSRALSDALYVDPACHDIPLPGARIAAGAPLCTLMVSGPRDTLADELDRRRAVLLHRTETCREPSDDLIPSH